MHTIIMLALSGLVTAAGLDTICGWNPDQLQAGSREP